MIYQYFADIAYMNSIKKCRLSYLLFVISYASTVLIFYALPGTIGAYLFVLSATVCSFTAIVCLFYIKKILRASKRSRLKFLLFLLFFYLFPPFAFYHLYLILKKEQTDYVLWKNNIAFKFIILAQILLPLIFLPISKNYIAGATGASLGYLGKIKLDTEKLFHLRESSRDCQSLTCYKAFQEQLRTFYIENGANGTSVVLGLAMHSALVFKLKDNQLSSSQRKILLIEGNLNILELLKKAQMPFEYSHILPLLNPTYGLEVIYLSAIDLIIRAKFYFTAQRTLFKSIEGVLDSKKLTKKEMQKMQVLKHRIEQIDVAHILKYPILLEKLQRKSRAN